MQRKFKSIRVAVAATLALGSALATAQNSDIKMNVSLKDADLVTATRMITEKTGVQFYFTGTKQFSRVTTTLKDQTADDVIRYICDAAGAYVSKDANGVYRISADKPAVTVAPVENRASASIIKKIKLLHQGADDIFTQVVMGRILDPLAKHRDLGRAFEMAKRVVAPATQVGAAATSFFDSAQRINQFKPSAVPAELGANQSASDLGVGGSSISLPGTEAFQRGGGAGLGGGGGGQLGGGGGQLGGGGGQLGGGGGLGQGGGTQLTPGQGLVPSTIDFITYDPTDNSLIVRGSSEEDINQLANIIAQFDVAPKQVSIKVEFITTTENVDQSLGYSIQYSRGALIAGMNQTEFQRASDPVFFTYASGDAVFRLRTRISNGYGRVVTAPVIRTVNNTPATVFASTTDYILSSVTTSNGVGGVNTFTTPQAIQIGTSLSVTPRINGDGTISLGIAPTVSSITGTRSIAVSATQNQEVPIFTTQSVTAVIIVKDGDTIVLGGLNTDSTNTLVNRVPVLSDLPIVGQFFKRTQKQKTSSELLIFVTPKIIDDSDNGFNP